MQVRTNINPAILTAVTAMLQPYVPDLSPKSLVQALEAEGSGPALKADKPLTRREAATLLSVSLNTINRYMNAGLIRRIQMGKRLVRIDAKSVRELMERGGAEA